ncbi:aldehyde dehydrogenase family protein [Paenalcaligenes niemegkensis]|nr:aldehyde dehydrogenase family protein [Paenalcaligenes niemegkensis]MCQ9617923.1 aldehyde dehydrogenase family protein [Paenalcaligenes niemegkensis]
MQQPQYGCFIDGNWGPASSGAYIEVLDPATGRPMAEIARGVEADVNAAVESARKALPSWANSLPVERARILAAISRRILQEQDRLARLESQDTGKPLQQAQADAIAAARFLSTTQVLPTRFRAHPFPLDLNILTSPFVSLWG